MYFAVKKDFLTAQLHREIKQTYHANEKVTTSFTSAIPSLIFINAQSNNESFISTEKGKGKFPISAEGKSAPLLISSKDWPGVIRAFKDLQSDIGKVTSVVPELYY